MENSSIQLNHVAFTRNKLEDALLWIKSNCSASIQNHTLTENNISNAPVYYIMENSSIQLNHVAFTRKKLEETLLWISSNSSAIIRNNILIENNISFVVYAIMEKSSIQLNDVAFTRNKLEEALLWIKWNCRAIIDNNTLYTINVLN